MQLYVEGVHIDEDDRNQQVINLPPVSTFMFSLPSGAVCSSLNETERTSLNEKSGLERKEGFD